MRRVWTEVRKCQEGARNYQRTKQSPQHDVHLSSTHHALHPCWLRSRRPWCLPSARRSGRGLARYSRPSTCGPASRQRRPRRRTKRSTAKEQAEEVVRRLHTRDLDAKAFARVHKAKAGADPAEGNPKLKMMLTSAGLMPDSAQMQKDGVRKALPRGLSQAAASARRAVHARCEAAHAAVSAVQRRPRQKARSRPARPPKSTTANTLRTGASQTCPAAGLCTTRTAAS